MRRALALALVLVLAGCVVPDATTPSPSGTLVDPEASFLALDHDHGDPALHSAAAGLALTAHPDLDPGAGYFGELDIMGDMLALATEQPQGAVLLLDISNPDAPKQVGRIALDDAIVTDVKIAPDAKTLFVSTSSWLTLGAHARFARDPSALPTFARALGLIAFDVADPARPREIAFAAAGPDGAHMIDVHVKGGITWVFASTPAYSYAATAVDQTRRVVGPDPIAIFKWTGSAFEKVADYNGPERDSSHDMTVVDDDGKLIMLVPYYFGVGVADVTDPSRPTHLGSWSLAEGGIKNSNVHTVMMTHVEGQRVLIATPELGEAGQLLVIDATDFGAMKLIGTWALPDWEDRKGVEWSPHNVNVIDGKIYFAHYHGGAWVIDISTKARLAAPEVAGYYAPSAPRVAATTFLYEGAVPSTWDVVTAKGRVFVSDMGTGLHVLKASWTVPDAPAYGERTTP